MKPKPSTKTKIIALDNFKGGGGKTTTSVNSHHRATGLELSLPRGGFTHPEQGNYLMLPKQFKAILALETKAVAQVIYEIIEQTIGWEHPTGRGGRREWATLSLRHFELACAMSLSQVQNGLKAALQAGYITRRPDRANGGYEYAIVWRDT